MKRGFFGIALLCLLIAVVHALSNTISKAGSATYPTSSACQAYQKMIKNCTLKLPHEAAYNSTHQIKCNLVSNSSCHAAEAEINYIQKRSTFWHCTQNCWKRFHRDLLSNIDRTECTSEKCFNHTMPAFVQNLQKLARALYQNQMSSYFDPTKCNNVTNSMTNTLLVMQNALMIKSRFCIFDFELYTNYVDLLSLQAEKDIKSNVMAAYFSDDQSSAEAFMVSGSGKQSTSYSVNIASGASSNSGFKLSSEGGSF